MDGWMDGWMDGCTNQQARVDGPTGLCGDTDGHSSTREHDATLGPKHSIMITHVAQCQHSKILSGRPDKMAHNFRLGYPKAREKPFLSRWKNGCLLLLGCKPVPSDCLENGWILEPNQSQLKMRA